MYIHKSNSVIQVIFYIMQYLRHYTRIFQVMPEGNIIHPNSVDGSDAFHGFWSLGL